MQFSCLEQAQFGQCDLPFMRETQEEISEGGGVRVLAFPRPCPLCARSIFDRQAHQQPLHHPPSPHNRLARAGYCQISCGRCDCCKSLGGVLEERRVLTRVA